MRFFGPIAAALLASASASAQRGLPVFDVERLELNSSAQGSLLIGTGRILGEGGFRLSLAGHYEREPLLAYVDDERVGAIIRDRLTLHLGGAYGVGGRAEFGFQLPFVAMQAGDDLSRYDLARPAGGGIGTPQIYGRVALLQEHKGAPVGLVAGLSAGLPLGSAQALAREPGFTLMPHLAASRAFGMFLGSAQASFLYRSGLRLGRDELGSQVGLGAAVSTLGDGLRGELSIRGMIPLGGLPPAIELLGGVRYPIAASGIEAFALAGPGFGQMPGSPQYRALLGVAYAQVESKKPAPPPDPCAPGQPQPVDVCTDLDKDADGVRNAADTCPLAAEDVDGHQDEDGCPDGDNDGDGFADGEDKCPNEQGVAEHGGCPPPDRDRDGILDADDECPDEGGTAEKKGCPFRDQDKDGLEDAVDACPAEAGLPETRGCPVKDTDGDSVADHEDNCVSVKGDPKNAGCPKKQKQLVVITREKLVIKDKVYFATNKAKVLPRSFRLLKQIATIIKEHPEIPRVIIEGHTDDRGKAEYNRKLSQARADAVKSYLITQGVDPARLASVGYGPDRPADTNKTARGREANRRVEFSIVDPAPQPGAMEVIEPLVPAAPEKGADQ